MSSSVPSAIADYKQDRIADPPTHASVERFYTREAFLLDSHEYSEWIPLLEDDFAYRVPVTLTRDDPSQPPRIDGVYLIEESRDSLKNLWARRLEPEHIDFAWGEVPLQRVRHFVTNVAVFETDQPDQVAVLSNVLLTVVRQSDPVVFTPAQRRDVLRRRTDGWGLVERTVHMDESVISLPHLRIVI